METVNYQEWNYENFSCWDRETHGVCLSYTYSPFDLHPQGLDGDGERLVVEVWDRNQSSRVIMSYIGSDGSLLCKQDVQNPKWEGEFLILPPGPKFEEVVRTRTDKQMQKDVLTLRLYLSDNNLKGCGCTTIDVSERYIKVSAPLLKSMKMKKSFWISSLSLDKYDPFCHLDAILMRSTQEDDEISIVLKPKLLKENVLIRACVSLLDCHDVIIKSREGKHLFRDEESWTLATSFKFKEVNENQFYLTLGIKFIFKHMQSICLSSSVELVESSTTRLNITSENGGLFSYVVSSDSPSVAALSQELMYLCQDQDFSDIRIKCDSVTFPAHRAILSARSPVFKTMLTCDMREAASNEVDIEDLDAPTLVRFLTFLYTGKLEDLQGDSALKLYYAADKYQVPTLMRECVDFLSANASVSNVCGILLLADKHQEDELTAVAHSFILKNYNAVLCSDEWKDLVMKESLLCAKTLTQFAEQNRMREINTNT